MSIITGLKSLKDNYIWAIHGTDESRVVVIDPGEDKPVLEYLTHNNLKLDGILLTHHHWDHTNGVSGLLKHFPSIPVYSSEIDKVAGTTAFAAENQDITFQNFSSSIKVLNIPGHTLGHVAYVYDNALFCGDTLFSCGCGKIFEGTPSQMVASLQKLKQLPLNTLIYCGHEYTLTNIAFAQTIDPNNKALDIRKSEVEHLRNNNQPSLPTSLNIELQTNPFLRCEEPVVLSTLKKFGYIDKHDPTLAFAFLRELKNKF
jgi:hydroxyacylglutathione hydrolase